MRTKAKKKSKHDSIDLFYNKFISHEPLNTDSQAVFRLDAKKIKQTRYDRLIL